MTGDADADADAEGVALGGAVLAVGGSSAPADWSAVALSGADDVTVGPVAPAHAAARSATTTAIRTPPMSQWAAGGVTSCV